MSETSLPQHNLLVGTRLVAAVGKRQVRPPAPAWVPRQFAATSGFLAHVLRALSGRHVHRDRRFPPRLTAWALP